MGGGGVKKILKVSFQINVTLTTPTAEPGGVCAAHAQDDRGGVALPQHPLAHRAAMPPPPVRTPPHTFAVEFDHQFDHQIPGDLYRGA